MRVLVIGSGAREHAIVFACTRSERVDRVYYCGLENGGISMIARHIDISPDDFEGLSRFANEKIGKDGLTIVGPEASLARGIVDRFTNDGLVILGPSELGAGMERSKYFCHLLLGKYGIQTAPFRAFISRTGAKEYIKERYFLNGNGNRCVIKADELMAGKGVLVPNNLEEALKAVDHLFSICKDKLILVEDYIAGNEYSFTAITDGKRMIPFAAVRDYKRQFDGDVGPNTGGQGCFGPVLNFADPTFVKMASIAERVIFALGSERIQYRGFLYLGFMVDKEGEPIILEINVRLGDPEAQVILNLMDSDPVELFAAAAKGDLKDMRVRWKNESCVCVVISSSRAGYKIYGLEEASKEGALVFHARTKRDESANFHTNGEGRTLSVVASGKSIEDARSIAYNGARHISFWRKNPSKGKQYYRKDIAFLDK